MQTDDEQLMQKNQLKEFFRVLMDAISFLAFFRP